MADTTARVLRLLELLQSAQLRTMRELAGRLEVDERTIRRDVARLTALGLPVESVRGRQGGYRLAPGESVLPLVFSSEEAVAVYLGLSRAPAAPDGAGLAAQTALAKVVRALPVAEAERVAALLSRLAAASGPGSSAHAPVPSAPDPVPTPPDPGVMLTLAEAVQRRRVLDLRYRDGEGTPTRRTIHPSELVPYADRWYLVAVDAEKRQERVFRVDRIRTVRAVEGSFAQPGPRAAGDPVERLLGRFAAAERRWRVVLRIHDTEERIRMQLPPSVARLEPSTAPADAAREAAPPWYRAEIHAERLDRLPAAIAALDCEVVIEEPDELRSLVRAVADRMLRAADAGP